MDQTRIRARRAVSAVGAAALVALAVVWWRVHSLERQPMQVPVGLHTVTVNQCWGLFARTVSPAAVTLIKRRMCALPGPEGHIHIIYFAQATDQFLAGLMSNSIPESTYPWGTARRLQPSYYAQVLGIAKLTSASVDIYVPEKRAVVELMNADDLKQLQTL